MSARAIAPDRRGLLLGGTLCLYLLLTLLAQELALALILQVAPALTAHGGLRWLLLILSGYLVAFPAACLLFRRIPAARPAAAERTFGPGAVLTLLLLCFGLMHIGNCIGNLLMQIIAALTDRPMQNPVNAVLTDSSPLWSFFTAVIVAPIGEELLFRRLIIDRALPFGERTAIFFSALTFAAFHLNLNQFFYAFLLGLVFACVYVKTGRLRFTVALHAVVNLFGGVLATELLRTITACFDGGAVSPVELLRHLPALLLYASYSAFLLCAAGAAVILCALLRRRLRFADGIAPPRALWLAPTVPAFFLLCALIACLLR